MFATATSVKCKIQRFELVAGLLQKQLYFAIGCNWEKRFFEHSHKREVQITVLCNLLQVFTKSNFVLQRETALFLFILPEILFV